MIAFKVYNTSKSYIVATEQEAQIILADWNIRGGEFAEGQIKTIEVEADYWNMPE
jgi:hypothetical protein